MARPIVLSNGELHVGLNKFGVVHDLYYPYVGFENHAAGAGLRHKVGVYVDGQLSWTDDGSWEFEFHYPHTALIGHTKARNQKLGIMLEFDDVVDMHMSAFIRNIHIINLSPDPREVKLFMYQAFAIGDSRSNTDTAQYLPDSDAVLHYRGRRAFIISGQTDATPFDQYSVGLFGIEGHDGSYRDAEDGELSKNNVEHGRVDSILRLSLHIDGLSSERAQYWIAAGMSMREALYIHRQVKDQGVHERIRKTAEWWHDWLQPALQTAAQLPKEYQDRFIESVMIVKSQLDKRGAVIASTDSTLLNYSKDNYAYCWPRDGANVVWPLIRLGYYQEAYRFFEFCQRGLHPNGYLMHKYRADGALGSSWHPYIHGDVVAPPIQEDETALVVFVFVQFYMLSKDSALIKNFYHSMIKPMANFMAEYIDETTGLPKPSYDLWEVRFLINTHTVAVTHAALLAASDLAVVAGDEESAVKWRAAADDIQAAAHKHLFNSDRHVFYRGLIVTNGQITYDDTIDTAAIFGAFLFGLFDANGPQVNASINTIEQLFGTSLERPGLPRHEDDDYRRSESNITGNWWYITTLWKAQYAIENGNLEEAHAILSWVHKHMLSTGMMGEQIDPITDEVIAPAPLTWSHAEYLSTLIDLLGKN
ncbi:MAG TPA: glycoside hydrolase family 15 protein [Dongiaceae bacterium]|nr:glycoside hydrolase family 15 protein [Dongiaceae bacterium]